MEGQIALLRSFEHLVISSHGCLRARPSSHFSRSKTHRHVLIPSRSITSTPRQRAETPSTPSPPSQKQTQPPQPDSSVAAREPPKRLTLNETFAKLMDGPGGLNTRRTNRQPAWKQRVLNNDLYGKDSGLFAPARSPTLPPLKGPEALPDFSILNDLIPSRLDGEKPERVEKKLRLKPSLGRSVVVDLDRNMDLTRAFQTMEARINGRGNAVRKDARNQRYHVRQGQAKKIKRRTQWRIMFKAGFMAECARVKRMLRQGW